MDLSEEGIGNSHRPVHNSSGAKERAAARRLCDAVPNITGWAGLWAWPLVRIQSLFSRKPNRRRKSGFLFLLKMSPTLIWYFTQGL